MFTRESGQPNFIGKILTTISKRLHLIKPYGCPETLKKHYAPIKIFHELRCFFSLFSMILRGYMDLDLVTLLCAKCKRAQYLCALCANANAALLEQLHSTGNVTKQIIHTKHVQSVIKRAELDSKKKLSTDI